MLTSLFHKVILHASMNNDRSCGVRKSTHSDVHGVISHRLFRNCRWKKTCFKTWARHFLASFGLRIEKNLYEVITFCNTKHYITLFAAWSIFQPPRRRWRKFVRAPYKPFYPYIYIYYFHLSCPSTPFNLFVINAINLILGLFSNSNWPYGRIIFW